MIDFVSNPNIPQNYVCDVIMSNIKADIVKELKGYHHINVIDPGKLNSINASEAYHAYMSVCHISNEKIVVFKNIELNILKKLTELERVHIKKKKKIIANMITERKIESSLS